MRRECGSADAVAGRVADIGHVQDDDQHELDGEQHPKDLAVDVDAQRAHQPDDRPRDQRVPVPLEAPVELLVEEALRDESEDAVEADLQHVVGEYGDERGADAERLVRAQGDVAVERARVDHVPRHGDVPSGEDR